MYAGEYRDFGNTPFYKKIYILVILRTLNMERYIMMYIRSKKDENSTQSENIDAVSIVDNDLFYSQSGKYIYISYIL